MTTISLDEVAMLSAAFSLISIAVTVLTVMTQKMVLREQSFVVIGFDVKDGTEISIKSAMTRRTRGIRKDISSVFGVHKRAIDIERGQYLSAGGIHLEFQVDVNEDEDVDLGQKVQTAIDNGEVNLIFQKRWKLKSAPVISNLNCQRVETEMTRVKSETGSVSMNHSEGKTGGNVTQEGAHSESKV